MKRVIVILLIITIMTVPVRAAELSAPTVPKSAEKFMPSSQSDFTRGLLEVLRDALLFFRPNLKEAASVCLSILSIIIAASLLRCFPGASERSANLATCIGISLLLLHATNSLISLAASTVAEISEYGKLLLPVMTAAMAGQGAVGTSAALYSATALFDALLTSIIRNILTPMVYLYLALSIAASAIGEEMLSKLRDTMKGVMTWCLKTILYIYTGFISISGVVSGATDAAALKAAKLTISSVVPVVGSILSDASEAVLVAAGTVKNASGIYGLFAVIAIWIGPFLQIGSHYLLLKATGALCSVFGSKESTALIQDFSAAMGFLLAMTGTVCLMLLISLVCFLKGVG